MDYSSAFAIGDNHVNQEKPPPRVCPRCNSNNTKFCYYNNYTVSQPRYKCKECLRHWTHGGALRNIPIGGGSRKISAENIQQVNRRHQPFLRGQESNQFVGYFGGSSSSGIANGNQVGSFPETHGDMGLPFHSFPPMHRSYIHDGLFQHDHYNVDSNDLYRNHLNNQLIGSYNALSSDRNSYINQRENQNQWNHQSFNNTMNMNHNASTSGSRQAWDTYQINKNYCVSKSPYQHGP
ncbi:unnamed protein product [Eruca vesicaria subsp. sativa]|uniref:Dof zinc finger protein n=1 Tax=Eruca vesicaria subsp. sativa TaxID=29727 RepID=A0ABC8M1U6_ERUVS|nr:unnamed protein product [Eruca vesicaria subsp. sativa]